MIRSFKTGQHRRALYGGKYKKSQGCSDMGIIQKVQMINRKGKNSCRKLPVSC